MDHFQEFKSVFQKLNPAAKIDDEAEEFLRETYGELESIADSLVPENKDETKKFSEIFKHEIFQYEGDQFMKTGPNEAVTWNPEETSGDSEEDARPGRKKMDLEPKTFFKETLVEIQKSS